MHQGCGAQISVCSYEGTLPYSLNLGADLLGVPITESSPSQLYCMAKPVMAASLTTDPAVRFLLDERIGRFLPGLQADLAQLTGWSLLDHSACIQEIPVGVLAVVPRSNALEIARSLRADLDMGAAGLARYHDVVPWLFIDEILLNVTGKGLYERAEAFAGGSIDLSFNSSDEPNKRSAADILVDGVTGPPRWLPFRALNHTDMIVDRLPILSCIGTARGLSMAISRIGMAVENSESGTEKLIGRHGSPLDPSDGQRYGAGTLVGMSAHGVGEIGDGIVGHLGCAGSGASWFDPQRRLGCCMRIFGLDLGGDDALRFRIRSLMARLKAALGE